MSLATTPLATLQAVNDVPNVRLNTMAPVGGDSGGVEGQGGAAFDVAPLEPNLYQDIPVESAYMDFHEGGSQTSRYGARLVVLA